EKDDKITVEQTEKDKKPSTEETTVKAKEESSKPKVDQPTEGDDKITGEGEPGSKIVVKDEDDNVIGETTVDDDGKWEVPVPADKPLEKDDKITVEQTEKDKKPSTEETTVKAKEEPTPEDTTKDPSIDQPTEGDDKITGKGEPESKIVVELPDGTKVETEVDEDGNWKVDVPADKPLKPGDKIKVTQTDKNGKTKDASAIVKAKYTPEPEKPYDPGYRYEPSPDYLNNKEYKPSKPEVKAEERELDVFSQYVIGNEDRLFMPHKGITRAEVAQIFARALRYDGYKTMGDYNPYSDVNANAWYYDAVVMTTQAGVFRGTDKGTFEPNREITKAELIATIARFQQLGTADGNSMNMRPDHWALGEVEAAYQEGWLDIYTKGLVNFDADMVITRAEVVSILNRAFGRIADIAYIDANADRLVSFTDVAKTDWFYYDVITAANTYAAYGMNWVNDSNGLDNEFTNLEDIVWETPLRNDKEVVETLRRVKFQRNAR
ncbi:Ig-like domain-containing protein, partial [uncultured Ezakiella sp.]|uniref:Ig-like domain-containing protein n=1 Tax=uncultured Ezakiella sp. TaxID=1637529 RepID=UPI0025D40849